MPRYKTMFFNKRVFYPLLITVLCIAVIALLPLLEKKPQQNLRKKTIPSVEVKPIELVPFQISVESQGVIQPKYNTNLIAEVSGRLIYLSEAFDRGGFVKKGEILAKIDPSDYKTAILQSEADLLSAEANLELEKARAAVAEAEWKHKKSVAPSLSLRKPQLAREKALVRAAKASLERSQNDLKKTVITAPFDALIDSRSVGLGTFIQTGSLIGELKSAATGEVRLPIKNNDLLLLPNQGLGSRVELMITVGKEELRWPATVVRTEGIIDDTNRMMHLIAEVEQPYQHEQFSHQTPLSFGSFVKAKIDGLLLNDVALVPSHLIDNDEIAIFDDHKLVYKTVTVLANDGLNAIITEGVNSGDQLIITPIELPIEGMSLELLGNQQVANR